jgi:hypothetical protein
VKLQAIAAPPVDIESPLAAMEKSLQMEEDIYEKLLHLHKVAGESNDPNFCDFIGSPSSDALFFFGARVFMHCDSLTCILALLRVESTFLDEQVQALKTVSDHVTNLRRLSSSELGVRGFFDVNECLLRLTAHSPVPATLCLPLYFITSLSAGVHFRQATRWNSHCG